MYYYARSAGPLLYDSQTDPKCYALQCHFIHPQQITDLRRIALVQAQNHCTLFMEYKKVVLTNSSMKQHDSNKRIKLFIHLRNASVPYVQFIPSLLKTTPLLPG